MLPDEISAYLAGQGIGVSLVSSTSASQIFNVPFTVEGPDAAACIIEYPGFPADRAMGAIGADPLLERPKFQVLVRDIADNAYSARLLAKQIYSKLMQFSGTLTGSTGGTCFYAYLEPMQSPFFLRYDEAGRIVYAINFKVRKVLS